MHTEFTPFVSVQSNLIKFFLVIRYIDLSIDDNGEWKNAIKITLISAIAWYCFWNSIKNFDKISERNFLVQVS